jgi:ABC-type Mn/Zn transport systems, ATPase component
MEEYSNRLIGDLSGGEQQRVLIARALVSEPEIIFLDEPTIGVDIQAERELHALLKQLNKSKKLTLVLVSHDVETLVNEATHIACIDRVVVCNTSAHEFLKNEQWNALVSRSKRVVEHHTH